MFVLRCHGVMEGRQHAYAIDGILFETIDALWRRNAENFIKRWCDIVDVIKLRSRRVIGLDLFRPGNHQWVPRPAEVRGD